MPNKVYLLKGNYKLPQGYSYPIFYKEESNLSLLYFLLLELVGWNRDRD